ncbi:MAG: redoxin domain-containing protein [Chloroflexota bacterium]
MLSNLLQPKTVRMPELSDGYWFNSPAPLTKMHLRGSVVLIDFWDFTCVNCIRTLPYLVAWYARYQHLGLKIIGIHTPEFKFSQTKMHVEQAIDQFGLHYPVLLDNQYENWTQFAVKAWPTKLLIDPDGYIRYQAQGEGRYQQTERAIQQLLRLGNPNADFPQLLPPMREEDEVGAVCYRPTPELYAGYQGGGLFGGGLGNSSGYMPDQTVFYKVPPEDEQMMGHFYVDGAWKAGPESMSYSGKVGGRIQLVYEAAKINAVIGPTADQVGLALGLRPTDAPPLVWVRQNGRWLDEINAGEDVLFDENGRSYLNITQPRMYQIAKNHTFTTNRLELTFQAMGLALFSFSFSSCVAGAGDGGKETFVTK